MRHIVQRVIILGTLVPALLAGLPITAVAEFGQVQMGVNGMI